MIITMTTNILVITGITMIILVIIVIIVIYRLGLPYPLRVSC